MLEPLDARTGEIRGLFNTIVVSQQHFILAYSGTIAINNIVNNMKRNTIKMIHDRKCKSKFYVISR
jgi:hypothetical protein